MPGWDRKPGFDLTGKTVFIVGASTPASTTLVQALAEAGADVGLSTVTLGSEERERVESAVKDATELGRNAEFTVADAREFASIDFAMRHLAKSLGAPTALVFAGDLLVPRSFESTLEAEFALVQAVNLQGAFAAAQSFVRLRNPEVPGRIIFLNTILAERGVENVSAYAAARAGVTGLMTSLSQELGGRNITVNCIATGWMDWTPGRGPDDIGQNRLMRFIPARRWGTADELSGLAVLLLSDAGGYMNGQTYHVDGGIMTHL